MSSNPLDELNDEINGLVRLAHLSVKSCGLQHVPRTICLCRHLVSLDLSHNRWVTSFYMLSLERSYNRLMTVASNSSDLTISELHLKTLETNIWFLYNELESWLLNAFCVVSLVIMSTVLSEIQNIKYRYQIWALRHLCQSLSLAMQWTRLPQACSRLDGTK